MKKYDEFQETNEFERDIQDLREWQNNQYNPGHYIGTGRVPRPVKGLGKFSILLIALGIFIFFRYF
ncbi:hypothetical protein DCMF_28815 [Candidatus Formimonas warabiya]|uniref:Uncharacterized protein n=1 Tax=Formimonas warabiya TaxID=1761012 RepID=A0A3G1L0P5_FORW1|nr:hypothetical protein DCMF_28815 [Candidatus Formimonas warabiya]